MTSVSDPDELRGVVMFDGALNVRDLGGLPREGGGFTRFRRLIRADSPHGLSAAGLEAVAEFGITTVVDLRTDAERQELPSRLLEVPGIRHIHAPIFTDANRPVHLRTAVDVYLWWFTGYSAGMAAALAAIADAEAGPVLIHCHAGKDRTGMIAALLLRLAGVSPEVIADDYELSAVMLAEMLDRDRERMLARGDDPDIVERVLQARRETILEVLSRLQTEHGEAVTILRMLGLDDERIERLSALLVADAWPTGVSRGRARTL